MPINPPYVGMYTCGPTVYDYIHIGNIRKYIGDDILRRVLVANNYMLKHIMNITDVGHLTSDEDAGDDKMEKGAKEKNMDVWELAKFYTDYFFKTMNQVNNFSPNVVAPATEHIGEQIKLIEKLFETEYAYQTDEAIYFDVSKFLDYTKLSGQNLEDKNTGSREEVRVDFKKKNPQDFALWFFTVGHFKDHIMKWPSPWGEGFPGWHIECSAISMEYLGNTIDIHTGGVDHIAVHHTNEIAQSEAATGKKFVNYWVHVNFLQVNSEKMSKSKNNFYTIDDINEKGFEPMAFRYLVLTAHYRDKLNFTWESLQAAQNALNNLREIVRDWNTDNSDISEESQVYLDKFMEALNNDLNTSQALAMMWELVKSSLPEPEKVATLLEMDVILGLDLHLYIGQKLEVSDKIMELVEKREKARIEKDFEKSDKIRKEINDLGFTIEDSEDGPKIKKG